MSHNAAEQQASLRTNGSDRACFDGFSGTVVLSRASSSETKAPNNRLSPSSSSQPSPHRLNSELWRLVLTDKLTGLCNQHGFIALADQQWRVARRESREMVFVGLELENLQEITESQPRGEADLAVMAAGRILVKSFRRSDVVCRWSGGEFRVLVVNAEGLDEAMLRSRIQNQVKNAGASGGYALVFKGRLTRLNPQMGNSFAEILTLLDQDLVESKRTWCGNTRARPTLALYDAQGK
jgi:diguanylate cyclase (GGDEF)-like protein